MRDRYDLFDKYGRRIGTAERELSAFEQGQRIGEFVGGTVALIQILGALLPGKQQTKPEITNFAISPTTAAVCYRQYYPKAAQVAIIHGNADPIFVPTGTESMYAVAISQDGRLVATGGKDHFVRLIDAEQGIEIRRHKAHWNFFVDAIDFSPDGKTLYFGIGNNDLRVWDIIRWQEIKQFKTGTGVIWCLSVAPQGDLLAVAGGNGIIKLLDTNTGAVVGELKGHTYPVIGIRGGVRQVVFSHQGNFLASAGSDSTVRVWDVASQKQIYELRGHTKGVWSVDFSSDGALLVSGSDDQTVRLWQVKNGQEVGILQKMTSAVCSVNFAGNNTVYAAATDGNVAEIFVGDARVQEEQAASNFPVRVRIIPGEKANTWKCSNCGGYVRGDATLCKHCKQPFY